MLRGREVGRITSTNMSGGGGGGLPQRNHVVLFFLLILEKVGNIIPPPTPATSEGGKSDPGRSFQEDLRNQESPEARVSSV